MLRLTVVLTAALVLLVSCAERPVGGERINVDLNRTTAEPMTLHDVLRGEAEDRVVAVNASGSYLIQTDSLPTGIYVATWDELHSLPLLVRQGRGYDVCGTWQEWNALSCSDAETVALWEAEALRREVSAGRDTALAGVTDVFGSKTRQDVVDSINAVLSAARGRADRLLGRVDTSLVSLAVLGIGGLYDAAADHEVVVPIARELRRRYPDVKAVRQLNVVADSALAAVRRREALSEAGVVK